MELQTSKPLLRLPLKPWGCCDQGRETNFLSILPKEQRDLDTSADQQHLDPAHSEDENLTI